MATLFIALRAILYISGFVLLWGWLALAARPYDRRFGILLPAWTEPTGIVVFTLGVTLALTCAAAFVVRGRGTPAVFDAPREFVSVGPYKYVRNPMYIGGLIMLIGFGLHLRSPSILVLCVFFLLLFHLFVVYFEEPTLREQFGATYERYCERVPRWVPRTLRGRAGR